MSIVWNTGLAAARARPNLKLKKNKKSKKLQAASAKARQDRIKRFDKALDNLVKQVKAASSKRQASSTKELDSYKIPDIK